MFFHSYLPNPVLLRIGSLTIYWYGFFIFLAFWLGFFLTLKLAEEKGIKKEIIINLIFWLFIFSLIGARLYHVILEINYYWQNPLEILFFWQGGLGIFGAMIFGFLFLYFYSRKYHFNLWTLLDLFSPAVALGIAIIRWGNYFNQEIYGLPTDSFLRIPISLENRLPGFERYDFFQPLFFIESIFCLFVFLFLILRIKKSQISGSTFISLALFYSTFRFFIEFLRIDPQPIIFDLRFGQIISLLIFITVFFGGWMTIKKRARPDLNRRSSP